MLYIKFISPSLIIQKVSFILLLVSAISLTVIGLPHGAALAREDGEKLCQIAATDPADPILQNYEFIFVGAKKVNDPGGNATVIRIPEKTELRAKVDGAETQIVTGKNQTIEISINIGITPDIDKPEDTREPWSISLTVMEASYDKSVASQTDMQMIDAAVNTLTDKISAWRSEPLIATDKERLQRDGTLTISIDNLFDEEMELTPQSQPLTIVVVNRPQRPKDLYERAKQLKTRQDLYDRVKRRVDASEGKVMETKDKAETSDKRLSEFDKAVVEFELDDARTLLGDIFQTKRKISVLKAGNIIDLKAQRAQAIEEKKSIKLYVDAEAEFVREEPGTGFKPLDEVIESTNYNRTALIKMLREQMRDRYAQGDPEISSLDIIDELISSNPQVKTLTVRQGRLEALQAEYIRRITESDETIADLTRRINEIQGEISSFQKSLADQRNSYAAAYGDFTQRVSKIATLTGQSDPNVTLAVDTVTPEGLDYIQDWLAQKRQGMTSASEGLWQQFGSVYTQYASADNQLSFLLLDLLANREDAVYSACISLSELENADQYEELISALRNYITLMKYVPAIAILPTAQNMEFALGKEPEDVYSRRILGGVTNNFLKFAKGRVKIADKFLLGATYYTKVLSYTETSVKTVKFVADALTKDDPVVIFDGLSAASSLVSTGSSFGLLAVRGSFMGLALKIYADAGKAIVAAGNRIADRKVLEALEAVRTRPGAHDPSRKLYSINDIKADQYYKTYAWWTSDTDTKRIALVFQSQYIFNLVQRGDKN